MENTFDAIYKDPATIVSPTSAPSTLFFHELEYMPQNILSSLEAELNFSHMTSIQHSIFTTISPQNKIYNIISPPNTGTTTSLAIISLLTAKEYPDGDSILWIFPNIVNLNYVKELFLKIDSRVRIAIELPNSIVDIMLCSTAKALRKKTDVLISSCKDKIKMIVIDCADEILQTKEQRDWIGQGILKDIYHVQVGSYPTVYFTQLGTNITHVSTFIKELDINLTDTYKIRTYPLMIENSLNDTFKLVPQYYSTLYGSNRWFYKIIGNTIVRLRRGVLVCGIVNNSDFFNFQYSEINKDTAENDIFRAIEKVKKLEKKILICRDNLPKRIKSCGFGTVIHMGIPISGIEPDIQEYRSRVERMYSPEFVGVSIILCKESDVETIRRLAGTLNVYIERWPS